MSLLDYTTKVDAVRTIGEIEVILVAHGARSVHKEFGPSRQPVAVAFEIATPFGLQAFRLPVRTAGVLRLLETAPELKRSHSIKRDEAQATRIAWRIMKEWIQAQLALVETDMAALSEVMLPYLELDSGESLYERITRRGLPALPPGGESGAR